ncbi:hypothetical protein BU24DRAFT_429219 [Aaosphaeria arxii CBS 175.79]|uniref:Azaphilone pigments biosynthesis cluster protein L N-terminal domain-containing protein n=1 Tax=Aaosphaeria arxii CBS 175.79 TaxID=1450172 RepID=A0A6A5X6V2_9PLEO|nr:uncharacterized protein BU24DRAFT_429219 [Aaosphaeria arxii CBS 175.79]KAF2008631.1 hypothetical protein BU24DRAFT_429219 [Aaosphaeria arxii CBS 175.79]
MEFYTTLSTAIELKLHLPPLNSDVEAIITILHSIRTNLQAITDDDFSPSIRQCLEGAKPAITGCRNACTDFSAKLNKLMSHSSTVHFSKRDKAMLWFKEKKIMGIRYRLATYKGTLNVVLSLASLKATSESTSQVKKTQEDLDKFMATMQGQLQGLVIGVTTTARIQDENAQDGGTGDVLDQTVKTLESQMAALSNCLSACTLAQAELSVLAGTTIKYAEAMEDSRQLFGQIGAAGEQDFQVMAVTIERLIAKGRAVQLTGRMSEDVAFAALGMSKE